MQNYRTLLITLIFLVLISVSFSPSAYASTSLFASNDVQHSAYSFDWGWKNFNYTFQYQGDAFSGYEVGSQYEAVKDHDFAAYKTPSQVIWPDDIGNGTCVLYRVEMVDSRGNVVDYLSNSSFQNGTIRGYIVSGGTLWYFMKKSYNWLQNFRSDTYYVKAKTSFYLDESWYPSGPWVDTASTQMF